jgi:hypothetical protein
VLLETLVLRAGRFGRPVLEVRELKQFEHGGIPCAIAWSRDRVVSNRCGPHSTSETPSGKQFEKNLGRSHQEFTGFPPER